MSYPAIYIMAHEVARARAIEAVKRAPEGYKVTIAPPTMNDSQRAKFNAMAGDIARQIEWMGKKRTQKEWRILLISGHAKATHEGDVEMLAGLEGELVNVRESTTEMSRRRGASLITYVQAFGDTHGVEWSGPVTEEW
jgi:hypothetical protein